MTTDKMKIMIIPILIILFLISPISINGEEPLNYQGQLENYQKFKNENRPDEILKIPHAREFSNGLEGSVYEWMFPKEFTFSPITGFKHRPNSIVKHIKKTKDQVIFDVDYSFDQFGRRVNTIPFDKNKHKEYIAIFGCSFTYGNGLNDNETLHYHLTQNSTDKYAYNYAIGGSGPHMMLALMENNNFRQEMNPKNGTFIYIHNDFHIPRANFFMNEASWLSTTPIYEKKNDELINLGFFNEVRPWTMRFYSLLRQVYSKLGIHKNWPQREEQHYQHVCDLIKTTEYIFATSNPKSQFYVYSHPISPMDNKLSRCLKKNGIKTIHSKIKFNDQIHTIKGDGHPNQILNQLIAKELLKELPQ